MISLALLVFLHVAKNPLQDDDDDYYYFNCV